MNFIADLHVHSKYSIATARDLDLEHMYIAAQRKGLGVVGTGDFTHPAWFEQIEAKLQPDENGLYRLKADIAGPCDAHVPASCRREVRFILQTEISNIYKKDNKTRKNHNLVYMPNRRMARAFNQRLDRIGNIRSDGRPILGLDARNLLEIMLEVTADSFLIPAHIWTPWFSVLGSKSGFDALEECYADLSGHIFAVETGLSSDPRMNWRISALDGLSLVSNSDAHSPAKLGREANRFDTDRSFDGIRAALQSGDPEKFLGTFEYYPEEGKYHLDGHRKCRVRLAPAKTIARSGLCPVCGKPLTLGVLYRIEELADRPEGVKPPQHHAYAHMLPLIDILSELLQKGPQTKAVTSTYDVLVADLGPEFDILHKLNPADIARAGVPFLDEAIRRMRQREILIHPGYDGEFGTIEIFKPGEREKLAGQRSLFKGLSKDPDKRPDQPRQGENKPKLKKTQDQEDSKDRSETTTETTATGVSPEKEPASGWSPSELNPEQQRAVEHVGGPLLIVAGPGTGKTRTLTCRIAHLIQKRQVPAAAILAVTFTHKAAHEMRTRLAGLLGADQPLPLTTTFHSFCLRLLAAETNQKPIAINDEADQRHFLQEATHQARKQGVPVSAGMGLLRDRIMGLKQQLVGPDDPLPGSLEQDERAALAAVYQRYQHLLARHARWDYEDLIMQCVTRLESDAQVRNTVRNTYQYVFIDEYQDLNHAQYRLVKALSPDGRNLCVIGDPDQAIYGFRGSNASYFTAFENDYPEAAVLRLARNYRSTQTILDASYQVIQKDRPHTGGIRAYSHIDGLRTISILRSPTAKAEAVAVGKTIERLVGGTGFHAMDFDKVDGNVSADTLSFGDFAVLYRTRAQGDEIAPVLEKAGIPIQIANRQTRYQKGALAGLTALLKVTRGMGSYLDFRNIIDWMGIGIGEKAWQRFKTWGYENDFDLNEALHQARRFPIPGMRRDQQSKIDALVVDVHRVQRRCAGLDIGPSIRYVLDHTPIGTHFQTDVSAQVGLRHLFEAADRSGSRTMDEWLTYLALEQDTDLYDAVSERVALMTLHAAKGLEFPVVFIVGCEEGYLPHRHAASAAVDIAEERRLFYVAMTRARAQLFLSWAQTRVLYGSKTTRSLSPFVVDIEENLKALTATGAKVRRPPGQRQLELF